MAKEKTKHKAKRSRTLTCILLSILCLLAATAWFGNLPAVWQRLLADRALKQSNPSAALDSLHPEGSEFPTDVQALLLAVRACVQLNMNAQASIYLNVASEHGLAEPQRQVYEDIIAAQQGSRSAAERLTGGQHDTAVPPEAYESVLRCSLYHGKFDRVALILQTAEGSPDVMPWVLAYYRGRMAEVQEDFAYAASFFESAFALQSNFSRACFRAAFCHLETGQPQPALKLLQSLADPYYSTVASVEQANCLWELGQFQKAKLALADALDQPPTQLIQQYVQLDEFVDYDRAALVAARIEDAMGQSDAAIQLLQRVLKFNNRSFEARTLLVKNLRALGRLDEAQEIAAIQTEMIANRQRCQQLRDELETEPLNLDKRCELAELYWTTESEAEALLAIDEIFQISPDYVRAKELLQQFEAAKRE